MILQPSDTDVTFQLNNRLDHGLLIGILHHIKEGYSSRTSRDIAAAPHSLSLRV
jgi:hypothetical protein